MIKTEPRLQELMTRLRVLPGVGLRTAQRMALHLLTASHRNDAHELAQALQSALDSIGNCRLCRMLTEDDVCTWCRSEERAEPAQICVVENYGDALAIEQTNYQGRYFVLQGCLSPLEGITPKDLGIDLFIQRVQEGGFKEVILATNLTVEGETTAHYLREQLAGMQLKISRIAQGVPMGGELGYMDGPTLGLALLDRRDCSH